MSKGRSVLTPAQRGTGSEKIKKQSLAKCSSKLAFLKISQYSQEKICVGVSFDKVAGLKTCKATPNKRFPVNIANFLRTHFLQNTLAATAVLKNSQGNLVDHFAYLYYLLSNISAVLRQRLKASGFPCC